MSLSQKESDLLLVSELKDQRYPLEPRWHDVASYFTPYRQRFTLTDIERNDPKDELILDGTGSLANRTLVAGMMSYITSPAKVWAKLKSADPELNEFGRAKDWLELAGQTLLGLFPKTKLYPDLANLYTDMAGFATGTMGIEEDLKRVFKTRGFLPGSYWLGKDEDGYTDTFYTEWRMTVRQVISEFALDKETGEIDWSKVSSLVKTEWENKRPQTLITVGRLVAPNDEYDYRKLSSKYKKFRSCTFEIGSASVASGNYLNAPDYDAYLKESGYDLFPVLAGRWYSDDDHTYGTSCPGFMSLPDNKQLQHGTETILAAADKSVDPPVMADPALKGVGISSLPGKITWWREKEGQQAIKKLYEFDFDIAKMDAINQRTARRIDEAHYVDLFKMLALLPDKERTATEIAERKEEKLVQLGPVLDHLNPEVLDPLMDRTFMYALKQRRIPPPPPELWGAELRVEYVGIIQQAQKAIGGASIDRVLNLATAIFAMDPDIVDKVDFDQAIDEAAAMAGAPARMIRDDEETNQRRGARQQAQAQQAQAEKLAALAKGARDLGSIQTDKPNALTDLVGAASKGAA